MATNPAQCPARPVSRLRRFLTWMKNQVVQPVPGEIGVCEFACRKTQCSYGEWAVCPRRLEDVARRRAFAAAAEEPVALGARCSPRA